jgi:hypothetical protein
MLDNENDVKLENIIQSNHYIRHRVQESVNEFLHIRRTLLSQLQNKNLNNISNEFAPLIDAMCIETLNQQVTSNKVQLALCGENSSGKTSFIHLLLGIGDILPVDIGPITARIIKMTYAIAEEACAIIYSSLEESFNKKNGIRIDLSSFFILNEKEDEPDWEGIADTLADHVRRPKEMDVNSKEFAIWAKHFIEIYIPSSILKLGIDVYDTAGFRVRDAQILKDCLFDLVRLVHPTLVFLYDNPSSSDETNDCFLALKDTLKQFDSSNIFFLNTKADIDKMPGINQIKTEKQFNEFLKNERIKRYNLLLKTPGMVNAMPGGLPKSFDKCHCFDLCSVNSEIILFGRIMNKITIQRLIQFVANSDLIMAQRVSNLVLPGIEAFFDLTFITSHRTNDQLEQLRSHAQQWVEIYFQEHREAFNKFLRDVFHKIFEQFSLIKDDLARRAVQQKDITLIKNFIQLAIKQEVMKNVVYDALGSILKTALEFMFSNQNLTINATSNEILVAALRIDTNDRTEIVNEESRNAGILRCFIMQTITAPALMVTDLLFTEENDEIGNNLLSDVNVSQPESEMPVFKPFDLLQEAHRYIIKIQNQMINAEMMFTTTVSTWCTRQKTKLQKQINQQYQIAMTVLPVRHQAYQILQQYAHQFVRIECQLQAAKDLAKFNGKKPFIRPVDQSNSLSPTTVYRIDEIEWNSIKKNLFVKRLTQPIPNRPYASYLEAHYHRKITQINIPNIIQLTYLYENQLSDHSYELWIIFETQTPGIKRTLNHFLDEHYQQQTHISLKKVLQILISIINALAGLHENELVHRNVQPSNILIDEEDQTFLADLGDWNLPNNKPLIDIESRHQISITSDGINDDIKDFGKLAFRLLTIIDSEQISSNIFQELKQLIETCIKTTIKAAEIRQTLKYLYDKLNRSL